MAKKRISEFSAKNNFLPSYLIIFSFALHCTPLHCTALNCTALQCTALHCTALHWSTLYSMAGCIGSLLGTNSNSTAQHCTAMYNTVLKNKWLHNRTVHCTIHQGKTVTNPAAAVACTIRLWRIISDRLHCSKRTLQSLPIFQRWGAWEELAKHNYDGCEF